MTSEGNEPGNEPQRRLKSAYEIAEERARNLESATLDRDHGAGSTNARRALPREAVIGAFILGLVIVVVGWIGLHEIGFAERSAPQGSDAGSPTPRVAAPAPAVRRAPPIRTAPTIRRWYIGGTLHDSSARDWSVAEYKNRLATAADFVAAEARAQGAISADPDDLLSEATALERCMSEALIGQSTELLEALTVLDLGAACLVIIEH